MTQKSLIFQYCERSELKNLVTIEAVFGVKIQSETILGDFSTTMEIHCFRLLHKEFF